MLDTSGINEYIFGTNKLREIRGASILLDSLNRDKAVDELKKNYGTKDQQWECIVAGGGNIKVIFDDEDNAEKYKNFLKKLFSDGAKGVGVTVILSVKNDSWTEAEWIKDAQKQLQRAKLLKQRDGQVLTSGYFKTCQACGVYPAEKKSHERFVCSGCIQKIDKSSEHREMEIYKRLFKSIDLIPKLPQEFGDIGEKSHPRGYIGFIYADGNRMGEHLARIKTFDDLKEFSKNVEESTFRAAEETIKHNFKDDHTFQIILAGGDDLIMVVPAHKAISVAVHFCDEFNNMFTKDNEENNITTSAAVVLCHDSMPIKDVLESAEGLLKNAKIRSRDYNDESYIDFLATTGSALGNPISRRKKELEFSDSGNISLTMRPYSIKEMIKISDNIINLKKNKFPRNKLKTLYASLFKGFTQGCIEALYMKTRLSIEHHKLISKIETDFGVDMFPWKTLADNKYETPLNDLIELYEFIESEGDA